MIKAIQLLRLQDPLLKDRIRFTAALFCGHMKSARFVESFAWQMNVPLNEIQSIDFRYKMQDRPANWYIARVTLRNGRQVQKDWWHLADGDWGAGFFMNSACNFCDDVVGETADFSTGDAWIEPYASDDKGTNVLIVRRTEIQQLIIDGIMENRLDLKEVSKQIVEQTQAAGFRQRRQGLAYRLLWATHGIQPNKRVVPDARGITKPRKRIYWMRFMISKWSHRTFWLARQLKQPAIYLSWARAIASLYYGLAYHQGSLYQIKKRYAELKK
jgi:coenzyme F420-reducing hydrogenase beta subunit